MKEEIKRDPITGEQFMELTVSLKSDRDFEELEHWMELHAMADDGCPHHD